ncbi:MAG: serine/threonine protein kinase [Candidatus Magasanikbacteria bacterium]|nr:serine/threonine protein kinase [Candidatus Magasanikbacteria bacterium]
MPRQDHYAMLEVHERAQPEVIRAAHAALTAKFALNAMVVGLLDEALAVLIDGAARAAYDAERRASTTESGTIIGGEYRVLEFIAEGAIGRTYRAEEITTGGLVCVKHCSRVTAQRERILTDEARNMWDLRHSAIPAIRRLTRVDNGSLALVMSFMPGRTIEKIVADLGRLHPESVAWITERMLNALWYLHDHGVVHGDIKPQNAVVADDHMLGLVDFGLAMVRPTASSRNIGYTECFAPPEQVEGKPILPESDFYALGATMIYMLSGGNLDRVKEREVPTSVPAELRDFIRALVTRDVLSRPRKAEDLFKSLKGIRRSAFGRGHSGSDPIRAAT